MKAWAMKHKKFGYVRYDYGYDKSIIKAVLCKTKKELIDELGFKGGDFPVKIEIKEVI